jgi:hypothetical protein
MELAFTNHGEQSFACGIFRTARAKVSGFVGKTDRSRPGMA